MQAFFYRLADHLQTLLRGDEVFTCAYEGELSDFVRFNHAKIRQAGSVAQQSMTLDLIEGRRHAAAELRLSGSFELDRSRLENLVEELREARLQVPEDPFLLYATEINTTETIEPNRLPPAEAMVERILESGKQKDLVGILASGSTYAGFANSLGQRNWYVRPSFNFDWSLYSHADKAVKHRYAGFEWDGAELEARMQTAAQQLEMLSRSARSLEPGRYRVFFTPAALDEIIGLLGWDSFGLRAHRTRTTPLLHMVEEGAPLSPEVTILEHNAGGVAPGFQSAGFLRPPRITLIEQGVYKDCLVSPRSAAEYGVAGNGSDEGEIPDSIDMAPGSLPAKEALAALDTGLYVGNLWYLNYSDRNAARLTGMTRFATFWVEKGKIVCPLNVMRFDETLYHLLGGGLLGLTAETEFLLDPGSYEARSRRSARLPGILVDGVNFTL